MRTTLAALPLALLLAAPPARAQLSNRFVGVEAGVFAPLSERGSAGLPIAVAAGFWLEGDLDLVARVAWASGGRTSGHGAASMLLPSVGVRWSVLPAPLRLQLLAEVGWVQRLGGEGGAAITGAAGFGLEAFVARDLGVGVRFALRATGGAGASAEGAAGVTLYF
jgi:hypothetical protein